MKKIPTLFERIKNADGSMSIIDKIKQGLEIVVDGKTVPTIKWDGSACLIKEGKLYCRFDAKWGRTIPEGAIACCPPDPVTSHWPHWVPADTNPKMYKYQIAAFEKNKLEDGTYEIVGPHFQTNPYHLEKDKFIKHGIDIITDLKDFSFNGIKEYLINHVMEGIVFLYNGEPLCKIKSKDFGIKWREKI